MSDVQKDLVTWLHSQEEWLQEAAERLANTGAPLTEADIADVTALLKTPNGRKKTSHRTYPQLVHGAAPGSKVRLVSIGHIAGIDRLDPRTPLSFGEKPLCVIYGHNGSGKSGYTRILARASGKPRAPELRPNAYAPAPSAQTCTIKYSIDGEERPVEWDPRSGPIEDLRCVDIFDSDTADHYLSEETTASYIPPAVALLDRLGTTCDLVVARLNTELALLPTTLPQLPHEFCTTDVGCLFGSVKAETPAETIEKITTWTQDDQSRLDSLHATLKVDDPASQARALLAAKAATDRLIQTVKAIADGLGAASLLAIREARAAANSTRQIAHEATQAATEGAVLDGVGSDTWKALWNAARSYAATSTPGIRFPNIEDGARCVLCHQTLATDAAERLAAFEAFTLNQVALDAETAEQRYAMLIQTLPPIPSAENIVERCQAGQLADGWSDQIMPFLHVATATIELLRRHEDPNDSTTASLSLFLTSRLSTHADSLAESAARMSSVADKSVRDLAEREHLELASRKWTSQHAQAIRDEQTRLRHVDVINACKVAASSLAVSNKARAVATELITDAYVNRFNEELSSLGADHLLVEIVKRVKKGTALHQIRLKNATSASADPDAVLSEGERRVVALAAFLADVTGSDAYTPFIFDDPITSLDENHEDAVLSRLCTLSKERPVIIFTHRLSLVESACAHAGADAFPVALHAESWGTGNPTPGKQLPPLSALKNIRNEDLPRVRKILNTDGRAAYEPHATAICSTIRVLIERLIESVLLSEVVVRHRRNVLTNDCLHKLAHITTDDCNLLDSKMGRYSFPLHSQPRRSPVAVFTPDEIDRDLDDLIAWGKEFKARG